MPREPLYSVSRLKTELRMKPRAGALPAARFKNSNNNSFYDVYRLADCEALPPKREQTEKQKANVKKMLIGRKLSRFDADHEDAISASEEAKRWFERGFNVLDTETTGLDDDAQILELAIIDHDGNVLHDARYKPSVPISDGAYRVHGIGELDLFDKPRIAEDVEVLKTIMLEKPLVIFNRQYDTGLLYQSLEAFGVDTGFIENIKSRCAMMLSAKAYGATNRYGSISLHNAAIKAGVINPAAHNALGDCITTLAVLRHIAGLKENLAMQRELIADGRENH